MSIFKPKYKNKKTGEYKPCRKWYVAVSMSMLDKPELRICAYESRTETELVEFHILQLRDHLYNNAPLSNETCEWLSRQPSRIVNRLGRWGLITPAMSTTEECFSEYVGEFYADLLSNTQPLYARHIRNRVRKVLRAANIARIDELRSGVIEPVLDSMVREGVLGKATRQKYGKSVMQFAYWLVRRGYGRIIISHDGWRLTW